MADLSPRVLAQAEHTKLNVLLRRAGVSAPACDGPDCEICPAIAQALTEAEQRAFSIAVDIALQRAQAWARKQEQYPESRLADDHIERELEAREIASLIADQIKARAGAGEEPVDD